MTDVQLRFSTGDDTIDRVMRGYIAAFQAAFPGRLRCFVVAGGYAEGTATPLSDIDGGPVFRGDEPPSPDEYRRADALIRACSNLARIHLDAGPGWERRFYEWRDSGDVWTSRHAVEARYYVKLAYRIIWGEEFRGPIPLPPTEYWVRACFFGPQHMGSAAYFIAATRSPASANDPTGFSLTSPVVYPDVQDPFFGYARHPLTARDGTVHLTTRLLVRTALAGANAMVAWRARRFVASKADVAAAYREHIGDLWSDFIAAVDRTCRVELSYLVPDDRDRRRRLHELCAEMPAFENHVLEQYRTFMLEQLTIAADESIPLPDGEWLPVELAGWLLERAPDDVQALAATGGLPSAERDGRRLVAARPCLQGWAAAQLGRVRYPGDSGVAEALASLAAHAASGGPHLEIVRDVVRGSLAAQTAA